jgi:hypothetical protein
MKLEMKDYQDVARDQFIKYGSSMVFGELTEENINHIVHVGASVMMTRDKFLQGGSFVQAIVDNDLYGAVNRADNVMKRSLVFMTYLNSHIRAELEIERIKSPKFETVQG